jgi:hypothetical protein
MKITGQRGSWNATLETGEVLPVVHSNQVDWKTLTYKEGNNTHWEGRTHGPIARWQGHLNFIDLKRKVIIQKDKGPTDPTRVGYVDAFNIDDVVIDGDVITFRLISRIK